MRLSNSLARWLAALSLARREARGASAACAENAAPVARAKPVTSTATGRPETRRAEDETGPQTESEIETPLFIFFSPCALPTYSISASPTAAQVFGMESRPTPGKPAL